MPPWGELQVDQLRFMAGEHPDALAYRNLDAGTAITFAGWDGASNALARGLVGLGVQPGDRVSVYLPSSEVLRWIVAYAAIHKAGAVAVPTNTRLSEPELATILGHAEVAAVLTDVSLLPTVQAVRPRLSSLRRVVSAGADGNGIAAWDEVGAGDEGDFQVPRDPSDLADVMYTSGTTGLPKGIAVRHSNLAMIPNLEPVWTGEGWTHGAPMFTFAGIAFIYNPMKMGLVGFYQLASFDAGRWLDYVERERPAFCMLVPASRGADRGAPRLRASRPVEPPPGVDRERAAGAADPARPDRAAARRHRRELVRHDRGRPGVHRDAEGGDQEPDRLGRQARRADGDQDRRRRRAGGAAPSRRRAAAAHGRQAA